MCVPAVITSSTSGEGCVYFDGGWEVGGGEWRRACRISVAPQAQLLPLFFCLISVVSEGSGDGGGGEEGKWGCT